MIAELQTAISNSPTRRPVDHKLTDADRVKIRAERMALLMRGAPVAIGVSVLSAAITLAFAWPRVPDPALLLGWGGLVIFFAVVHLGFWLRLRRSAAPAHGLSTFARFHVVAMAINGMLWGALAPIFAVHGLLGSAFLPFLITGMTATAIASAGASWRAVLAFNVPALAPFAVAYAVSTGNAGFAIAAIVCLYGIATTYLAWTTHEMILRSIRLRSRNDRLLDALKKQVDAAHESEKRYRALIESSQDLTIIFSPEGRVVYASPSANAALGYAARALIGKTTKDLVHPADLAQFRSVGEKTLSKLGEAKQLAQVCLNSADGGHAAFSGRLTNMLYVPGVEGFVFSAARLDPVSQPHLHAAV